MFWQLVHNEHVYTFSNQVYTDMTSLLVHTPYSFYGYIINVCYGFYGVIHFNNMDFQKSLRNVLNENKLLV